MARDCRERAEHRGLASRPFPVHACPPARRRCAHTPPGRPATANRGRGPAGSCWRCWTSWLGVVAPLRLAAASSAARSGRWRIRDRSGRMAAPPAAAGRLTAGSPIDRPFGRGSLSAVDDRIAAFRRLHESGCFVLPNPWDVGSARYLESLGFKALASTSSGAAWSLGRPDNAITLELALAHLRMLVEATSLPVNADFEGGFADDAEGVARNVGLCLETGVAALSIEDSIGDPDRPLHDHATAVERLRAARGAIDLAGSGALLVGRAECYLT